MHAVVATAELARRSGCRSAGFFPAHETREKTRKFSKPQMDADRTRM